MTKIYTLEEQKENRKIWIEALRSGKYNQTSEYLRDNDCFCCLGVLCEVAGLPYKENGYEGREDLAPDAAMNFVGLNHDNGAYSIGVNSSDLATKNDNGMTFNEIANIIESEPEGLFKND